TRWWGDGSSPCPAAGGGERRCGARWVRRSGMRRVLSGEGGESGLRFGHSVVFLEHEVLGSLGQALSDDLGVERVGKDLCPIFERPVGGDAGRSSEVVTLGDDLEGE